MDAIAELEHLESLSLWGTTVKDNDIEKLANLKTLQMIDLTYTNVTGESLSVLAELPKLIWLRLDGCNVDDEALAPLSKMPQLSELYLKQTRVTDAGLKHLSGLKNLTLLDLSDCRVSDTGLASLGHLPKIRSLWLSKTIRYVEYFVSAPKRESQMKQTSIVICAAMLLVAASGATHECRGDDAEVKDRQGEERAVVYDVLASSLDFSVAFEGGVNAVRDLETAVRAKFADVPPNAMFRILARDLQLEGITQNQRVQNLELKEKTVAEILTAIAIQMNPIRADGPSSPDQRVVWTVGRHPESPDGGLVVLITTRAAATKNGYRLPAAFLPADDRDNALELPGMPLQRKPAEQNGS